MLFIKEKSHTLTVAELPAHTHGRGTTEIQGSFQSRSMVNSGNLIDQWGNAAFHNEGAVGGIWAGNVVTQGGNSTNKNHVMSFAASRNWSGTSESIGSGSSINILNPYKVAYCFIRLS